MLVFLCAFCYISETIVYGLVLPPTAPPFALNVKLSVRPEKREAWLKQIKDEKRSTQQNEDRNLQFSISEDIKASNTFYLHEQYVDRSAFYEHLKSPHFERYEEFCRTEKPFTKGRKGSNNGGEPECFQFSPLAEKPDWSNKRKREQDYADALRDTKTEASTATAFCVTVNLYPKSELRKEFLKVIENNKKGTDNKGLEPLALQYTFGESSTESNVFHFYEQYKGTKDNDKEGFEAHAASAHFGDWNSFVGTDPFVKPPEVYFSKAIEE